MTVRIRALYESVADLDPLDVATRLTLLLFVVSTWVVGEDWKYRLPLQLLAVAGLLAPPLHRSRVLWLLILGVLGLKTLVNWATQDNHLFLVTWWVLALNLSLGDAQPAKTLATQARLMIGFSFAFAALWKGVLSDDFASGAYFHFTLLADVRFHDAAAILGGITEPMAQANLQALERLQDPAAQVEAIQLQDTSRLRVAASFITWWTLAIEAALAVVFLIPRLGRHRDALLLVFAVTTYLVANVASFGWTLLTLGAAQCESKSVRALYVCGCLLVLAYEQVPLLRALRALLGAG